MTKPSSLLICFLQLLNQVKALKRLGEILVDAIPHYYDADRSIRILGEDNAEKYVRINAPVIDNETGETVVINDLARGRYDVTVTVGKNFDTARMETAELAQALAASPGPMGMLGQYLMLKNLDAPGMDEIVQAARKVAIGMGLLEPGEKDGPPPPPPPPNPKDVADAEAKASQAALNNAKAEGQQLENQVNALHFGVEMGQAGYPPPPLSEQGPSQPPQGGFFTPEQMPPL